MNLLYRVPMLSQIAYICDLLKTVLNKRLLIQRFSCTVNELWDIRPFEKQLNMNIPYSMCNRPMFVPAALSNLRHNSSCETTLHQSPSEKQNFIFSSKEIEVVEKMYLNFTRKVNTWSPTLTPPVLPRHTGCTSFLTISSGDFVASGNLT